MKQEERKQRFALTILFSGIVFFFLSITALIVGSVIIYMSNKGLIEPKSDLIGNKDKLFYILTASVLIGSFLTIITCRIPLKPVNTIINAMNRLASGDFKTRLHFGKILSKHPTIKEITESFNHMAEELDKTEMLRSDFINNFSHEFKTPIVSIAGFARLLKRTDLTEEQRAEYIDIIEEESLRLAAMATNVLKLTRIENQAILTDISEYNLSEQIRSCILLLESKWSKKNIMPDIDIDEYYIRANEEMMKEVWINLIDNAIKYSNEGGSLGINIEEATDRLLVSVSNTGSPIPDEAKEAIFRKFYQLDESHSSEGNGLGLALVKEIVKLHKGEVTVFCSEGKTVFTVSLPRQL